MGRLKTFQPDGAALAAANAERDERAFAVAAMEFLEAGENEARAGRSDRMTEGDGATVHVEDVLGHFANGPVALEMLLRELIGLQGAEAGEYLGGEGFVDLDEIGVFEREAEAAFSIGDGEHWSKAHTLRITTSVG